MLQETIKVRPFNGSDADYEAMTAIHNLLFPEYQQSAAENRYGDETFDQSKYTLVRYMAVKVASDEVVGVLEYFHTPWRFDPQRYAFWIAVHPEYQRQGLGTRLYQQMLAEVTARGGNEVLTWARPFHPEVVTFLERMGGFYEISRAWESRINPQTVDLAALQPYVDRAKRAGITLTNLAEMREQDPDWLEKLYDLDMVTAQDVPSPTPFTPSSLEDFRRMQIDNPETVSAAFFVAKDGDYCVGLSTVKCNLSGPFPLYQDLTGVRREYRGRGIALALKVLTLEYAKQHGYTMLKTWNDVTNQAMLGINGKLGFERQPPSISFERKIEALDDAITTPAQALA